MVFIKKNRLILIFWCSLTTNRLRLVLRRLTTDLSFIYKLLNSKIDCPDLLEQIYLKVPVFNSSQAHLFFSNFSKNNFIYYSPLNRMLISCNNISNLIFSMTILTNLSCIHISHRFLFNFYPISILLYFITKLLYIMFIYLCIYQHYLSLILT